MKNGPFYFRLLYAWDGIKSAYQNESSFKTQIHLFLGSLAFILFLRPKLVWLGIYFLVSSCVLAAELFNTALESLCDKIELSDDPKIKLAKDCAAGAVSVFAAASVLVFISMLLDTI